MVRIGLVSVGFMGWIHYLARLGVAAAGGDPGPDPLGTSETKHGERSSTS